MFRLNDKTLILQDGDLRAIAESRFNKNYGKRWGVYFIISVVAVVLLLVIAEITGLVHSEGVLHWVFPVLMIIIMGTPWLMYLRALAKYKKEFLAKVRATKGIKTIYEYSVK